MTIQRTFRVPNGRISETQWYRGAKNFEAYWAGSHPPSGVGEDLVAFDTFQQAADWLVKKGASKRAVNKIRKEHEEYAKHRGA